MTSLGTAAWGLALLLAAFPGAAQLRNVTINTESEEGKLLQQAGEQSDPNAKVKLLEEFLTKYEAHEAAGYVHLQLLTEYLKINNFDKALDHGQKAQEKAPQDLELAHFVVKAAEGKGDAEALVKAVDQAHAIAQKVAASPKPSDADEAAAWKNNVDFASQIEQYNQHALFSTALKQTSAQGKVLLLDTLRRNYPGGQFDKNIDAQYVEAYRQLGQMDKMGQAAEAALANEPDNEAFLYITGESYLDPGKAKFAQAEANAKKILDTLPGKAKPEGIADAAWATHKSTYMGLANSLMGRALANQGKFGPATKFLQAAVKDLKGNNEALAPVYFFLGFCAVKLNQPNAALNYLGQAAKIPGPFQAPANDLLGKVRAALSGR
jgi:tetratricopeptide (TPR) repeat protein